MWVTLLMRRVRVAGPSGAGVVVLVPRCAGVACAPSASTAALPFPLRFARCPTDATATLSPPAAAPAVRLSSPGSVPSPS